MKLYTYTLPRIFENMNIPIPIQSLYLRSYAERNNFQFTLPQTEITFKNSYHILKEIMLNLEGEEQSNIAMTSILILPVRNSKALEEIIKINKTIKWHFPLENLIMSNGELMQWSKWFQKVNKI